MRKKSDSDSMHFSVHLSAPFVLPRLGWIVSLLVVALLVLAACAGGETAPEAPAAEAPAAATEETVEEEAGEEAELAEPTEAPAEEEPEATDTPAAEEEPEATGTPAAEEEPEATGTPAAEEEPEATGTPAAEEEPEATGTPAAEEEVSLSPEEAAGGYLITISRGCGCHFNDDLAGMAGGAFAFEPGGDSIYPANITPHEETGIGSWSAEEIATAIRTGQRPDGEQLHPIMPYRAFSHLADEDALHIAAYLLGQEPLENDVPAREVASEPAPFAPDSAPPATAPTDPVARGEYLVQLARCGDCHTPRNEDGSQNMEMLLAGNRINEDEVAWNLTPHDATGLGTIPEEEIATFLQTGELGGSQVAGTMGELIDDYFHELTDDDALAIAAFLKSLPPIENDPE